MATNADIAQKFDLQLTRWLQEDKEDFIDGPAGSDDDGVDHIEDQLESTGSEYTSEADDSSDVDDLDWETVFNVIEGPSSNYYLGLEGTKWMKEPIEARIVLQSDYKPNIKPGPRGIAQFKKSPADCFELFFDESIMNMIAKNTNERIMKEQRRYSRERDAKLTDEIEIRALLGIIFLSSSTKCNREHFLRLFDSKKGTGMEAIYLSMSAQRYKFLMKHLRFHDPSTEKITEDKMAPIRALIEMLIINFQKYFTPSHDITLGDLLIPYQGRCGFRQYTPNKPDKYGIKMFALVDCLCPYTYNLDLYVGDNPGPYEVSNRKLDIVVRMTNPIEGEYRNVTMSNWFTSLETAEVLFDKKITITGSIKPFKKEVPRVFRTIRDKTLYSSLFGFSHVATLVQYICKPNKAALLMSTKHSDCSINIETGEKQKPEILCHYDQTKTSVEVMDKICLKNDVTRNSRRWSLTIFFRLMNIAYVNVLCVYTTNTEEHRIDLREFQTELGLSLVKPLLRRRMNGDFLPKNIKLKMCDLLNVTLKLDVELQIDVNEDSSTRNRTGSRGRCHICRKARINKTSRDICVSCTKFTCYEHSKYMCSNCYTRHTR